MMGDPFGVEDSFLDNGVREAIYKYGDVSGQSAFNQLYGKSIFNELMTKVSN